MSWKLVISHQLEMLCAYTRDASFTGTELPSAITPYLPFWRQSGHIIRHPLHTGREYTYHVASRVLEKYYQDPAWYLAEYKHREKLKTFPQEKKHHFQRRKHPDQTTLLFSLPEGFPSVIPTPFYIHIRKPGNMTNRRTTTKKTRSPKKSGAAYDKLNTRVAEYNKAVGEYNAAYRMYGKLSKKKTSEGEAARRRLRPLYYAVARKGQQVVKAREAWLKS